MEHQSFVLRENLRQLVRHLGLLDETDAQCCGVTLAQCHALGEIGRSGSLNLNTLAERLNLDKSTTSRTLNKLVEFGYAVREASGEDRRYVDIRLSDEGENQFKTIETSSNQYYGHVLEAIPSEKRDQVLESLKLLTEALVQVDEKDKCSCAKGENV